MVKVFKDLKLTKTSSKRRELGICREVKKKKGKKVGVFRV